MSRILALCCLATTIAFAAPTDTPPRLRLPESARPVQYTADLTLLTDSPTFEGNIQIEMDLSEPTSTVWLNGGGLSVKEASVTAAGRTQAATAEEGGKDFLGFHFPAPVPAGKATLKVKYSGQISNKNSAGIFQGKDGKDVYLYTQFEPIDARRAFPCFDEPGFKVPWQLTLHVKKDLVAVANTPSTSESDEPNGMKKVVFGRTKPLPSYLVAFAVGPFEIVDAGKAGKNRVPVRIIAPKGKAAQAKYAAEVTGPLLDQLEAYFGIPYPYEKLDSIAIPLTYGFGAMENAGLITYAQTLILADPARDTINRQRGYASVSAHEMAHQWFGNLVTMAWWDDTWLNEAFATWTSSKIIAGWKPEWNTRVSDQGARLGAMEQDSLVSARKIHQPIAGNDDIANAFDGITYQKGAAVIRMFESWAGEKNFQAGVQGYLKRYAYKNARSADFLDSISLKSEPRLTKAFSTFLDQPGVPLITAELDCKSAAALTITQKRSLPTGSTGSKEQEWQVPVCVRYETKNGPQRECFLVEKPSESIKLTKATGCPAWVSANADATGYYRVAYQGDLLSKLVGGSGTPLAPAERVALLGDLSALVDSGDAEPSEALKLVPVFAKDPQRQVVTAAEGIVGSAKQFADPDLSPNLARFVRKSFGERANALGWKSKPSDDQDAKLLRASLVPFVAETGEDEKLQQEARRLAEGWLANRQGIDPEMVGPVLRTAAYAGDRALYDKMAAELKKIEDRQQRGALLGAMSDFPNAEIVTANQKLLLSGELDLRESAGLLFGPIQYPRTRSMPFEFVKENFDVLTARMPSGTSFDFGATLPQVGAAFCDDESRQKVEEFFTERVKKFTGGPRNLAKVLESIRLCTAQKAKQSADIGSFLQNQ